MRRLRAYFLALVAMAGCFLVASLGLLDASLRERRRRADESGPGNGGEDAARMLGARVAAQSELIGNLTSRLGTIARLQRLVSERLGGTGRARAGPSRGRARLRRPPSRLTPPAAGPLRPRAPPHTRAGAPAMGSVPLAHDGGAAAGATAGPPPRARAVPPTPHAVVIFCFNRPQYLQRAMRSVLSRLPTDGSYTLAVSQDGDEPGVADVVRAEGGPAVLHLRHARALVALGRGQQRFAGYHCLAQHYGWALAELLEARGFESVIVLEDDIEVAPDFFGFFKAMAPLLDEDDSLLTVSVGRRAARVPRPRPAAHSTRLQPSPAARPLRAGVCGQRAAAARARPGRRLPLRLFSGAGLDDDAPALGRARAQVARLLLG